MSKLYDGYLNTWHAEAVKIKDTVILKNWKPNPLISLFRRSHSAGKWE